MTNKFKVFSGYTAWLFAVICMILSVKIKSNLYIGDFVCSLFHIDFNIIFIIVPFILMIWIFSSVFKNVNTILLNWLRLTISVLITLSFLSILINSI
ncbi:hypothetical protein CPT06_09415 [Bacillus vallismortis]|nr:hypothetical protein CPT06_09415 [Bacillus vallismortis]